MVLRIAVLVVTSSVALGPVALTGDAGHSSGGGRGGIRTHGALAGTPVFKTGALNHSATLPSVATSIT